MLKQFQSVAFQINLSSVYWAPRVLVDAVEAIGQIAVEFECLVKTFKGTDDRQYDHSFWRSLSSKITNNAFSSWSQVQHLWDCPRPRSLEIQSGRDKGNGFESNNFIRNWVSYINLLWCWCCVIWFNEALWTSGFFDELRVCNQFFPSCWCKSLLQLADTDMWTTFNSFRHSLSNIFNLWKCYQSWVLHKTYLLLWNRYRFFTPTEDIILLFHLSLSQSKGTSFDFKTKLRAPLFTVIG